MTNNKRKILTTFPRYCQTFLFHHTMGSLIKVYCYAIVSKLN